MLKTSGHTLSFALNMLAVHQEEQEALYQHIQEILPDGRLPVSARDYHFSSHQVGLCVQTYEDAPRLKRVTAYVVP